MTMTTPSKSALQVACPDCGEAPGFPCRSTPRTKDARRPWNSSLDRGLRMSRVHSARKSLAEKGG